MSYRTYTKLVYSAAAYCAGFSFAFSTHSSQQTVISFPATVTLIPPSLIAQSQTGHLLVFMSLSPLKMKNVNGDKLTTIRNCDFQNLAHLRILEGGRPNSRRKASVK
jgi:hypothetical protein